MPTLNGVFARISKGSSSISASDAHQALMKAGDLRKLSLTGMAMKRGLEQALTKADANGDGRIDAGEFATAIRSLAGGKTLPAWSTIDPGGTGALAQADLAALVKAAAKQKGGALGGAIDADGVAKIIIALLDDDGDGKISQAEAEQLAADL